MISACLLLNVVIIFLFVFLFVFQLNFICPMRNLTVIKATRKIKKQLERMGIKCSDFPQAQKADCQMLDTGRKGAGEQLLHRVEFPPGVIKMFWNQIRGFKVEQPHGFMTCSWVLYFEMGVDYFKCIFYHAYKNSGLTQARLGGFYVSSKLIPTLNRVSYPFYTTRS